MAKSGSTRPKGAGRSSGRGTPAGKGGAQGNRARSSAAAVRAVQGARGGRGRLLTVGVPVLVLVVVAALVVVGVVLAQKSKADADKAAAANSGLLASTAGQATGETIDGVGSNDTEQVLFHIHAHLAMYVNGSRKLLPYGVGIVPPYQLQQTPDGPFVAGGSKYYWLHTHDQTGIIHIESPVQRAYTLGAFFDVWKQQLGPNQLGPNTGPVTAFVNGKQFSGNPRDIPLDAHAVIQLDLGTVVPFANYTFATGL